MSTKSQRTLSVISPYPHKNHPKKKIYSEPNGIEKSGIFSIFTAIYATYQPATSQLLGVMPTSATSSQISVLSTSPQHPQNQPVADTFSWSVFDTKMKSLLHDVVRKSDLDVLHTKFEQVQDENEGLRNELNEVKTRMHFLEKAAIK